MKKHNEEALFQNTSSSHALMLTCESSRTVAAEGIDWMDRTEEHR